MSDLRDLLHGEMGGGEGSDFAHRHGAAVRGRVRRRRVVRAAGVGSAAAVSAGVLAFGGVALAQGRSASLAPAGQSASPSSGACLDVSTGSADEEITISLGPETSLPASTAARDQWSVFDGETGLTTLQDAASGAVLAVISTGADGDLVVQIAADAAVAVTPDEDGVAVFRIADGSWVTWDANLNVQLDRTEEMPDGVSEAVPAEPSAYPEAGYACAPEVALAPDEALYASLEVGTDRVLTLLMPRADGTAVLTREDGTTEVLQPTEEGTFTFDDIDADGVTTHVTVDPDPAQGESSVTVEFD
ncbi:hypothetical protein [Demequina litorisediminis]|uniref:Uncharacterized protein n=1 Tax=Demequina litorisediminis TaxID=1849022 RepID=A0ABQ6IDA7_9MICO|nr:hypothetical protein [Demequina litorisediminis]GMA35829.1 hypothetical protein GCM10025876_20330 [Demequina litorisediminis]